MNSLIGSGLLARIAMNPACEAQVAMPLWSGDGQPGRTEKKFAESVNGEPFMGEFGMKVSQRRRGEQFEKRLLAPPGEARSLKEIMADFVGKPAEEIFFTDIDDECGTSGGNIGLISRLNRTRHYISAAIKGGQHPDIIAHPTLLIPTAPGRLAWIWVEPDFIVWDSSRSVFVPGDAKSFVVRDGIMSSSNLELARLQLGCQVVGLQHEYERFDFADRVAPRGMLVFATPYGLRPHDPEMQDLRGACDLIKNSIPAFVIHRDRILQMAAGAPTHMVFDQLKPNFQPKCISTCLMASRCRRGVAGTVSELGDLAGLSIPPDMPIQRVMALIEGHVKPADKQEVNLQQQLREIAVAIGLREDAA